ncbi:WD40 repeat domain-containing protein [Streptomyces sp. NPDC017638]|uniref:nSTAND1 domain-containing NTPase n=1 Tax=Streptomyces sp. NPDC017638 TaxID=3365004 RepID=UPI003795E50E
MGRREAPLDPNAGPVERFAFELRALRQEAGGPTYRQMAASAGYSVAALSQAAAGRQLPSLPVTLAYVRACGGDPRDWEARWREATRQEAEQRAATDDAVPPYRGLARFEPQDAAVFFGRDALVGRLSELCAARRLTAVLGPSGSGKSSLLRAGLIPRLRDPAGPLPAPAAVRVLTPGRRPLTAHRDRLAPAAGAGGDTWLIVDQFEELYTLCSDPAERTAFTDLLLTALAPDSRLRVVIAVRADFLGRCTEHPGLTAALQDATVLVGPMTREELRQAITGPATAAGLIVERSLTARVLDDVEGEPGGLPLMSHALLETWRHRSNRGLTQAAYEEAGGLHGAIARTAEEAYADLTPSRADLARRILLRLVAPGGDGTPDTRRPADRTELDGAGPPDETRFVVERLVRARLLTAHGGTGETGDGGGTVELAHEALITAWPRLRDWIDGERDRLRVHRHLTEAARAWRAARHDTALLYRGSRLARAEEAFPTPDGSLTPDELAFLTASARQRRQAVRLRRTVTALLAVLAILASIAAVAAVQQRAAAQAERNTAVFNRITAEADGARTTQASLAAQLDLTAYRLRATDDLYTRLVTDGATALSRPLSGHTDIVASAVYSPDGRTLATTSYDRTVRLWDIRDTTRPAPLGRPLTGHTDAVGAAAFSPDGRVLATGSADRTIRLWDLTDRSRPTSARPPLTGHEEAVNSLAFSPDGHTLASASDDRTVRLWDVTDPDRPTALGRPLTGHTDEVNSVAWSSDGHTVVSAGVDGTARLWDVSDPRRPARERPISVNTAGVYQAALSPDGRTLATAGNDALVRLWDVTDPRRPEALGPALTGHTAAVWSVAFSPDGDTLASAGYDDTLRLWNVANPRYPVPLGEPLSDHGDGVWSVRFGPDGRTLASAGYDGTARLWSLPATVLPGHGGALSATAWSPDGRVLVTADDNGVQAWDTTRPDRPRVLGDRLTGSARPLRTLAFAPAGRVLAGAGKDDTLRLWDLADPRRPRLLARPETPGRRPVGAVAFSPDGHTLATGGEDGTVVLWDVTDPGHPFRRGDPLTGQHQEITAVAFSPDGHILASASEDGTVRLWRLTGDRPGLLGKPLTGHTNWVTALAFSPDGRVLATAGVDRAIVLWNVTAANHPVRGGGPLTGHRDWVTSLAFSPDGRTLASGGYDRTVRLWDVADRSRPTALGRPLTGHTDSVVSVAFSPDGHTLASAGWDTTTRLWELRQGRNTARICAATGQILTAALWRRYVGRSPFDPPCARR